MAEVVIPAEARRDRRGVGGRQWAGRGWSASRARRRGGRRRGTSSSARPSSRAATSRGWRPARRRSDGLEARAQAAAPAPRVGLRRPRALAAWDGAGAVRLLDHDPDRRALLLERCRPGHGLGDEPDPLDAAAASARRSAPGCTPYRRRPAARPSSAVLRPWADELEGRLEPHAVARPGPGPPGARRHAHAGRRCARPVLLHGDLNPTNVLAATAGALARHRPQADGRATPPTTAPGSSPSPTRCRTPDPAASWRGGSTRGRRDGGGRATRLVEWCLVGAVEMGASAAAHGDERTAQRCLAHVALLAPHLP